jgi:hypothetical protein
MKRKKKIEKRKRVGKFECLRELESLGKCLGYSILEHSARSTKTPSTVLPGCL